MSRPVRKWQFFVVLLALIGLASVEQAFSNPPDQPLVIQMQAVGAIDPVTSDFLREGLEAAEKRRAAAVLIELDTPGGLLDATREIISAMLNTPVPTIVFVAPRGARATSAGVFITVAADIAAMAPETHLGAAHPVGLGPRGSPEETEQTSKKDKESSRSDQGAVMSEKAVSDAAAFIRTLAREKGRNADWAERAVRESVSLTAAEAARQNVIDLVAPDRAALFRAIDGKVIRKAGRRFRLQMEQARVERLEMTAPQKILHVLANPNFLYIFLILGIYGLIYEFSSPGVGFGAIIGVVCLTLAAYGMRLLPVNYAGLVLIGLGILLLFLEFQIASNGLLGAGGLGLLILGSMFLFDRGESYLRISLPLIGGTAAATGAFFAFAIGKALQARRRPVVTGREALIGLTGTAEERLDPTGMVRVRGELWTASAAATIEKGASVRVLALKDGTLMVEKGGE